MKTLGLTKFPASTEKPVLYCKTCGIWTSKVLIHKSRLIRMDLNIKRSKTWKRLVKDSASRKEAFRGKQVKAKEVYFSYDLMDCVGKKHKYITYTKPFRVPEGVRVLTW